MCTRLADAKIMDKLVLFLASLFISWSSYGQLRIIDFHSVEKEMESEYFANSTAVYYQKFTSPQLINPVPTRRSRSWTSSITSHSYGQGKVGTLYYWDMKGNLSETQGFIDIAGKNKRGLKLVFPWKQVYYRR